MPKHHWVVMMSLRYIKFWNHQSSYQSGNRFMNWFNQGSGGLILEDPQ